MTFPKLLATGLLFLSFWSGSAFAHVGIKSTSIENAAFIETLPETFSFSFSQPVGLIDFAIRTGDGERVDLDYKPPKAPADTFTVPLPDLAPGAYTFEWRTMSKDGHVTTGKLTFELR